MALLSDPALARDAFGEASAGFLRVLRATEDTDRTTPAGGWTLGELVAHTLRAYSCIELYLAGPTARSVPRPIVDAVEYYQAALGDPRVHEGIVGRAREAAAEIPDPLGAAEVLATRIEALVASTADDELVHSPGGQMVLSEYLVTRVVELALHTTDIQRVAGLAVEIHPTVARLILPVLAALGPSTQIILALTGRGELPDGFNVLS